MLCLASCFSSYSKAQTTTFNLIDDSFGTVNLNFNFPLYDRTFDKAYMYDNGSVSFLAPYTQNALSPHQWNAQPISQTTAKYFISPLWADLAPVSLTRYTVDQTNTTAKFTWSNIAEYYSKWGTLRLNTFSLQIDASGGINAKYNAINLQTSAFSIGVKGDADYTQIAYSSCCANTTTASDWSFNTPPPPTPQPVKQEPIVETVSTPMQESVQNSVQNSVQQTVLPTAATAPSGVPSIIEQPKVDTKKTAVKPRSVDDSSSTVLNLAISTAMTSADQSVSSQNQSQNTVSADRFFDKPNGVAQAKSTADVRSTTGQEQLISQNRNPAELKDAMDMFILGIFNTMEQKQDQNSKTASKYVAPTTDLGPVIPGFSAYTTIKLPDVAFYKPREVYRNQQVVDNARVFRSLTSDGLHEKMINSQYQR